MSEIILKLFVKETSVLLLCASTFSVQKYRREKVWEIGNVYSNNFKEMSTKRKRSKINLELTYVYTEIPTYINLSGIKFEVLVSLSIHSDLVVLPLEKSQMFNSLTHYYCKLHNCKLCSKVLILIL